MTSGQPLFDRDAVSRNRARATKKGMFLQDLAKVEIEERLKDVNRTFKSPAIVTGHPEVWRNLFPHPKLVDDTEALDLEPNAHDVIVHAMNLHWANDPVGQLVQARHALRADGLFLAVLFGGQTLSELRTSIAEAETRIFGGLSPRIAPMGEIRDLGAVIQRAGLALPVADSFALKVTYATALDLMRDIRAMGETNALNARQKVFSNRNLMLETARIYQDNYADDDGRIFATFELIFLSGWAPDESQQQPLRPGSANTRLADALNTTELGLEGKPVRGGRNVKDEHDVNRD